MLAQSKLMGVSFKIEIRREATPPPDFKSAEGDSKSLTMSKRTPRYVLPQRTEEDLVGSVKFFFLSLRPQHIPTGGTVPWELFCHAPFTHYSLKAGDLFFSTLRTLQ